MDTTTSSVTSDYVGNWTSGSGGETTTSTRSGHSSFFISIGLITLPGIFTNSLALFYIVRDMRKAVFPAIILIFTVCFTDLSAVIFSAIRHTITRYVSDISYNICACISVPHTFFRTFAGVLNATMAVDRVLAICYPFLYKSFIEVTTWKITCFVAAFCTVCFSMFPFIGLGNIMTTVTYSSGVQVDVCSSLSYRTEPREKVYGLMFAVVGYLVVSLIVTGNILVIRSILRMTNRVACVGTSSNSSTEARVSADSHAPLAGSNVTSFEIAFAKLMGGLAAVYLVFEVPYNTLVLMQQFNITVDPAVKGMIHMLGGISYTCDPIVYILIRKVKVKRVINFLCRWRQQEDDVIREMNNEPHTRPV